MQKMLCVEDGHQAVSLRIVGDRVERVALGEKKIPFQHPTYGPTLLSLKLEETRDGELHLTGTVACHQCEGGIELILPRLVVGNLISQSNHTVADVVSFVTLKVTGDSIRGVQQRRAAELASVRGGSSEH